MSRCWFINVCIEPWFIQALRCLLNPAYTSDERVGLAGSFWPQRLPERHAPWGTWLDTAARFMAALVRLADLRHSLATSADDGNPVTIVAENRLLGQFAPRIFKQAWAALAPIFHSWAGAGATMWHNTYSRRVEAVT